MTKKDIQFLARSSYRGNKLDERTVTGFVSHLDRKAIKTYLRQLKTLERQRIVFLALTSTKLYNDHREIFEKMFPEKEILVHVDQSLILGVRIQSNDMIYEQSLRNCLENILNVYSSA